MIRKRSLGKTGLEISEISLGGVASTWLETKEAEELISVCLDNGMNYLDTYPSTGSKIGDILKKRRKEFFLSTRGGPKDIDNCLKALNVDFFDIFFLSMVDSDEAYRSALDQADDLNRSHRNKFRFLGVATHNPSLYLRIISDGVFSVMLFPCNCIDELEDEVFRAAEEKGVGIVAMKPLAGGNLTNIGPSLRYVLNRDVSTALIGMASPREVRENIDVLNDLSITDKDELYYRQIRKELGNTFCRYCGHCIFPEPCSVDIPIRTIMMLKTLAYQSGMKKGISDEILSKVEECVECGKCEERCPYGLPIMELLPKKVAEYLRMLRCRQ